MQMIHEKESPAVNEPGHRYLVFTSAGDASCLPKWLRGNRNFDLWVTYYGDIDGKYRELADCYNARKGGKFPNLHYVYKTWPHLLERYEAILVLDDDIVISTAAINRLFDIRAEYDLWLLQPAFDPRSKISHAVTRMRRTGLLRYTNFVEVGCPLFRKDKLDAFMDVYDPALVGWGTDWWYLEVLGPELEGKVAITDAVICVNPDDRAKGGEREIDKLQSKSERIAAWEAIKVRYNIESEARGITEYGAVPRSALGTVAGVARWALLSGAARLRNWRHAEPGPSLAKREYPGPFQAHTQGRG
jgi:hypothetical protein